MLNLIPYPSGDVQEKEGCLRLPQKIGVFFDGFSDRCMAAFCGRCHVSLVPGSFLTLKQNKEYASEEYSLQITKDSVTVEAGSETGVIRALTTVYQLSGEGRVPCCVITDRPRYVHRGLSLDCARHFFSVAEVKKIIEEISLVKMNVLHWHLTDDQGWRIESKKFPELQEVSGEYYTRDEIKDVCRYAEERGVEIIPEIDMPGHVSALLAAYPEYSCRGEKVILAEEGGIFPVILCAGKDKTYAFLEELLDEIVPLFPGRRVHIGGDEAPKDEWLKCPHCQARMKELGLTDIEDLQGWFSARVTDILKKHGKTAVLWNEALCAKTLPREVQIQYWTSQYRDSMRTFARKGGKWIYSDRSDLYLDYPYSVTSVKKIYDTVFCLGKEDFSESEGLVGPEAAIWSEHIADCGRLENMLFPRIYALAETSWSGKRDYEDFLCRLEKFILSRKNISYMPKSRWDP